MLRISRLFTFVLTFGAVLTMMLKGVPGGSVLDQLKIGGWLASLVVKAGGP